MDEKAVQYLNFLPLQLGDAVSKLATLPQTRVRDMEAGE